MAMVVNNWQDHSSHHSSDDVNGLVPLSQTAIDPVTTPPHHPTLTQPPASTIPPAPAQIHQASPSMKADPATLIRAPHTPTTPGNGSVSDGSNVTSLPDCSTQSSQQQPASSSSSEKPHIECVVSFFIC